MTTLPKLKLEEFTNFPTLRVRWEAELKKFESIDAEYMLGKFQKRNIIYRSLPAEVQTDLNKEISRDEQLNE